MLFSYSPPWHQIRYTGFVPHKKRVLRYINNLFRISIFRPQATTDVKNTQPNPPPQPPLLLTRAKRKSLAMAATVSVCFALCWLPWCVAMLLLAFEIPLGGKLCSLFTMSVHYWTNMTWFCLLLGEHAHPVLVILALLASLNSTTNPWIYLYFSSAVLQQVKVRWAVILWRLEGVTYNNILHISTQ